MTTPSSPSKTPAPHSWFEISNEGWRRLNAGRPLGMLLREAIQNSFDEDVRRVSIDITDRELRIEDDTARGFSDERLVYTVFLTDKADSPTKRGRKGRGLKELISACQRASVETVGTTVLFDKDGRHTRDNQRRRGTRIVLERRNQKREIEEALAMLRLIIPPKGMSLKINGTTVRSPRVFCKLEAIFDTVVLRQNVERLMERSAQVSLYAPRSVGEPTYIFEMGLPIQKIGLPRHVDVAQRVPLSDGRDKIDEHYRLTMFATIFGHLVEKRLRLKELSEDWITEVLTRCAISDEALHHFVRRAYPERSVLGTSRRADDRARQAGAKIIQTRVMSRGVVATLSRVLETSEDFVNRRLSAQEEEVSSADEYQLHTVALYEYLAERILGRRVSVHLMRKPKNLDGYVEDATYDRRAHILRINVEGGLNFRAPLSAQSLGIFFHELAHARVDDHDMRFVKELERIAGRAANVLMDEGKELRKKLPKGRSRP